MNTTRITNRPGFAGAVPARWVRPVVAIDAGISGLNGLAYLVAASSLSELFGPSAGMLRGIGAFLVLWAVALAVIATRDSLPDRILREVGYVNLLWVAGSVAAAAGLLALTGLGLAWCLLQAVVVAAFASVQLVGTRR